MKVRVIDYIANPGGGVRFVVELIKALVTFSPDIIFEVVSDGDAFHRYERLLSENGLTCELLRISPTNAPRLDRKWWHSVPGNAFALKLIGRRIPWDIKTNPIAFEGCDLVWYPWLHRHYCPSKSSAPIVATFHDTISLEFPGILPLTERACERALTAEWLKSSNAITVTSTTTVKNMERLFGAANDRFEIIRLTGAHAMNGAAAGTLDSQWTWANNPFVLCPANISAHKNHETLFEGLAKWPSKIPVVLVGHGTDLYSEHEKQSPRAKTLRTLDEKLRLSAKGRLHTIGYIDDPTYYALLNRAWAIVMPTLAEGGGSFPVAEAVARRVPVLCSDIPILREQFDVMGGSPIWFSPLSAENLASKLTDLEHRYPSYKLEAESQGSQVKVAPWSEVAENYRNLFAQHVSPYLANANA